MKKLILFFFVLLSLAPFGAARATVYFVGGEDSDFTLSGGANGGGGAISGYARASISPGDSGGSPPTNNAKSPTFTSASTLWIHGKLLASNSSQASFTANGVILGLYSPDGVERIEIRGVTFGQYKISTRNAAGTVTDLATMSSACFGLAWHTFDLYINYATSGSATLYCDGTAYATYSGDVTTNSATQLNQIVLGGTAGWYGSGGTNWAEIIVADTDTRQMRLITLAPSANGNTVNWDTGTASNVNETSLNDSTVNASGTPGQTQQYTVGALPSGSWTIIDLWLNMRAQVDTSGPQHIKGMVRTNSTDYTSSDLSPIQGSWGLISTHWATNPYTGAAWTSGNLGAAGFNIGFQSAN